jgi:NAD(P)-dependent dehydrogenase (short-subunit alcohol dehydrogenase family)
MASLSNKVVIITGASSGIGRAAAKLFAHEGAKVVVGARRDNELSTLVAEIVAEGGRAKALAGDVAQESYAKALVDLAVSEFGGLDIAFNNAGTLGSNDAVTELSLDDWENTLRTNFRAAFWVQSTKSQR